MGLNWARFVPTSVFKESAELERKAHVRRLRGEITLDNFISSFILWLSHTPLAQQEGK